MGLEGVVVRDLAEHVRFRGRAAAGEGGKALDEAISAL